MKDLRSCFTIICGFALGVGTACASTITFDELSGFGDPIPDGYQGLSWDNVRTEAGWRDTMFGYHRAVVSPANVAYNGGGKKAVISIASGTFDFNSAFLTAAFKEGLNIEVVGKLGGLQVYDSTVVVNTSGPSEFTFNYLGIDELDFISFGGVLHGSGDADQLNHFAMDDMVINSSTPDGGTTLFLLGLGLAGIVGLRRMTFEMRPIPS